MRAAAAGPGTPAPPAGCTAPGVEGILGLTRSGDTLLLDPCLPKTWPEVSLKVTLGTFLLDVTVINANGAGRGVTKALLDGAEIACDGGALSVPVTEGEHHLQLTLG